MAQGPSWRRWVRVFRRDPRSEVDEELCYHVEQRVREYVARGMDPDSARRAALERVGDVERVKNECVALLAAERRAGDRRVLMSVSWLDVKLGLRMLVKYPGLSLIAVIGLAVAITIGAGMFGLITSMIGPTLPLDEGDRIVSIQHNRTDDPRNPDRHALHDFALWRDALRSVQQLGAFRTEDRNLVLEDGSAELVEVAEMTASGFRVARVAPALGRPLIEDDEREVATPVVVIAHDVWQHHFDGDPEIIGRSVRLGDTLHTVIGVMPQGFRFPVKHHFWVPFRLNPSDYERGSGPEIHVFGRLAEGVTLERAQAELTTIGQRMASAYPDTHEHRRPRILPYTYPFVAIYDPAARWEFHLFQLLISGLLVVVSANVAVLIYARTATRVGEIAVRSALGASRRRIVTQLFVEAFVLSSVAAVVGLAIAGVSLRKVGELLFSDDAGLPFWIEFGLSPGLVLYVVTLAFLAAAIAGVLPALKTTGRRVHSGLAQLASRGSQMQLGRAWTALIVIQVAVAVAALPAAMRIATRTARYATADPGYPAHELVRVSVSMEGEAATAANDTAAYARSLMSRFSNRVAELMRRLEAEPDVAGATFTRAPPGGVGTIRIEVDEDEPAVDTAFGPDSSQAATSYQVRVRHVGSGFFGVFGIPVVMGRRFVDADVDDGSTAVIVNRAFAERIAGRAHVVGRRLRRSDRTDDFAPRNAEDEHWLEIVGVVPDFPTPLWWFDEAEPKLYFPAALKQVRSITLALRTSGDLEPGFAGRLRSIAAAVDPALELLDLRTEAEARRQERRVVRLAALAIVAPTLSVLLLSATGIYAMMSFMVARRRREIGIRTALGADTRRILSGIFARATAQLGTGIVAGLLIAAALDWRTGGSLMGGQSFVLLPAVAMLTMAVGLLAAIGPALRGLAVQPTDALREE